MASCSAPAASVDVRTLVDLAPHRSVDLRIVLQPEHAQRAERYARAAASALQRCAGAFGGFDAPALTLADPPLHGPLPVPDAVALERVHWWTTVPAMAEELAAARAVMRTCWSSAVDSSRLPSWFADGVIELMARRVVTPIFEGHSNPPGYAVLEQRYLDGFVPRVVRIRLMPESDVPPLSAFRGRAGVDVAAPSPSAADRDALTGKTVLALGTLERWLGHPVFDATLAEFVRLSKGQAPRLADFERVASDVSGQQLSWFFDQAFRGSGAFDYGIEALTTEPEASGGFVTTVVARRYGDALFTGAGGVRTGGFENGRGMSLRVTFLDGQRYTDSWDGRDERRTFRYKSPTRAVSATIDPDRVLLLDLEQTNNRRALAPKADAAATRWASLYLLWLEHLLLSFASLA